ncbi:VOC family protein [Halothiobacillus sp.]|jgi:glyoxylase I family protein|uniref:VOC family protein n=1 Tax=Halothiobacillus sp. TaxID=1891311 RepID=UPI002AD562DE|nr:VOC family protein [Halothiobacillus sp.]
MSESIEPVILAVDHVSVMVADVAIATAFYQKVIGLSEVARPDLGFPGAWLRLTEGVDLHVLQLPNPDPVDGRPRHGGRDRHVALRVASTVPFIRRLEAMNWPFTQSQSGRDAVFLRDPDGNALELVARPSEGAAV